jgi:flagellar hook protein FlgE
MSFSSFYAGLSGLQANADDLSVIGNNLANVNTVAFKGSRMTFEDIFSMTGAGAGVNGAGNPQQVGLGVQTASIDQMFSQGSLQTTGLVTDVAIQGGGFFMLAEPAGGLAYTRAGNFSFDKDGNLVTPGGQFVQGYTQRLANGTIAPSGPISNIQVPVGLTAPPQATSFINVLMNLNASAKVDDPATPQNEAEAFSTTVTIFDSLGAQHDLTLNFTPVDTNADGHLDQWNYAATVNGAEVTGGTAGTPFSVGTGTITFGPNGQLTAPGANVTLAIPGWSNNASAQNVNWQLFDPTTGAGQVTGFDGASATSSANQDGYGVGRLQTLTIGADGLISGVFSNGVTLQMARFAMAVFNNPNGLLKNGQNSFLETNGSGVATIGTANTGGRGQISASTLELSNVDVTEELTNLIISERGYQANSRTITTTDQIMQEALNLKR